MEAHNVNFGVQTHMHTEVVGDLVYLQKVYKLLNETRTQAIHIRGITCLEYA